MIKWTIIAAVIAGLIAALLHFAGLLGPVSQDQEVADEAPPAPSLSGAADRVVEFGDAPEYDLEHPSTLILYRGFQVQPQFPTVDKGNDWYVEHEDPIRTAFLGQITSIEEEPLVVDRDDDDGLETRRLTPCQTQAIELEVTLTANAVGEPLYLNGLFDWTRNGAWSGTDATCGTEIPEWGIQNLRLDQAPYNLNEPGVYRITVPVTASGPANVWARLTLTTTEVPRAPETNQWHGQGQFVDGESEDWIVSVVQGHQGLERPDAAPEPPVTATNPDAPALQTSQASPDSPVQRVRANPLETREIEQRSKEIKRGNNGVGNGIDPQPPGNPPQNDGVGTGPGNPGNKGGPAATQGQGSGQGQGGGQGDGGGQSQGGNQGDDGGQSEGSGQGQGSGQGEGDGQGSGGGQGQGSGNGDGKGKGKGSGNGGNGDGKGKGKGDGNGDG